MIPAPFKGLPITLVAAAITSLSFMGVVEHLFNVTGKRDYEYCIRCDPLHRCGAL